MTDTPHIHAQPNSPTKHLLRVAIVSDLHAYETTTSPTPPSHLKCDAPETHPGHHPIAGLIHLIEEQALTADLLLCGGDLGDKAEPAAVGYAWQQVHRIKDALSAPLVVATAGNHDVDSRHAHNEHDAKGVLQSLTPRFPVEDESLFDKFWSRHFARVENDTYQVLLLNSSAYHGEAVAEGQDPEYTRGRIADRTVAAIQSELSLNSPKDLNILLCHHHPIPHEEIGLGEHDLMRGGAGLIQLLSSGSFGDWIVIHGHKHHPRITYAPSSGSARPIVFAAGSLCADLYPSLQTRARNQFYLLEFPLPLFEQLGLVASFTAWDWATGKGWIPARDNSGLPHRGGFGFTGRVQNTAAKIASEFQGKLQVLWKDVRASVPEADFYSPADLSGLLDRLTEDHGYKVLYDDDGTVEQLDFVNG